VTLSLVRLGFGAATAAVITAGSVYAVETNPGAYDVNFYGLLLTALLPSLIYVFGVRERRSTVVCGSLLVGITVFGWAFVLQDDPMRGVGAVLAFPITFVASIAFAVRDRAQRHLS
jgi:hypothetical protein